MITAVIDTDAIVDTLRFRVVAASVVARRDVRVSVTVHALVSASDNNREQLEARVRATLGRFIGAQWNVVSTERAKDTSGYERVTLHTSARVPLEEDHNLDERARQASREGLSITNPMVDYKLPNATLDAETVKLQQRILEQALDRAKTFTAVEGRAWRIGDIEFGIGKDWAQEYSPKFTKRENAIQSGGSGGELLMTSERLMLVAQVTLKASAGISA